MTATCSYCGKPAIGWFWQRNPPPGQPEYVGWCREHSDRQTIEVNEESFR